MLLDARTLNAQIVENIAQFSTTKRFGPEKCPVYLRVPWIGKPSTNLEKEVKTAMESCYGFVSARLVFTSKRMLPVARKDVLATIQKSFVIYEYKCHCLSVSYLQMVDCHNLTHFFAVSLTVLKSSREQGVLSSGHCSRCSIVCVSVPQIHEGSPVWYPHLIKFALEQPTPDLS